MMRMAAFTVSLSRDEAGKDVLFRGTVKEGENSVQIDPPLRLEPGTYFLRFAEETTRVEIAKAGTIGECWWWK